MELKLGLGRRFLLAVAKNAFVVKVVPLRNGALLLRVVDGERDRCGRGKVDIDKIRQAAAPRSEPGNAEHIVIGNLGLDGEVSLMDLRGP